MRALLSKIVGAAGWLLLVCASGCGSRPGYERFVPSEDAGRSALEVVLKAWQNGEPPGSIPDVTPAIHAVDTHRRLGQRLERYEVLGPVPADGHRRFAVRLFLDNPREEQKARFVVIGLDPLWVFRLEDYERMIHWEMPMPDSTSKETVTAAPSR
jgi:hypothetical protein